MVATFLACVFVDAEVEAVDEHLDEELGEARFGETL